MSKEIKEAVSMELYRKAKASKGVYIFLRCATSSRCSVDTLRSHPSCRSRSPYGSSKAGLCRVPNGCQTKIGDADVLVLIYEDVYLDVQSMSLTIRAVIPHNREYTYPVDISVSDLLRMEIEQTQAGLRELEEI
jgi:hypothetical protein